MNVKLDYAQRRRANELVEWVIDNPDDAAYELIGLRDALAAQPAPARSHDSWLIPMLEEAEEPAPAPATSADPRSETEEVLRFALRESGCDGDLCMHEWHERARRVLNEIDELRAALRQPGTEEEK